MSIATITPTISTGAQLHKPSLAQDSRPFPSSSETDDELLSAVRLGNRNAFQELFDLHAAEVLALCERILRHRADAEDVLSDVFVELWRRRDRYDPSRGGSRTYLMQLARSRAIDRWRSRVAHQGMSLVVPSTHCRNTVYPATNWPRILSRPLVKRGQK